MDGSEWDLVPVGAVCPRSDILLLASHPRRLSRAIRTPGRTILRGPLPHLSYQCPADRMHWNRNASRRTLRVRYALKSVMPSFVVLDARLSRP